MGLAVARKTRMHMNKLLGIFMNRVKLEKDFELIRDHCIEIRCQYNTYTDLYCEENREILSRTAPTFFSDVAEIMHRDWILQVCKIMDLASTRRQGQVLENLTIKLVNEQLIEHGLMTPDIENVSDRIRAYGDKLTPARNKRIAHYDREHQINAEVLGETTAQELIQFLQDIQEYCDSVGIAMGVGPLDFTSSSCPGDALDLIKVLKRGANA